MEQPNGGVTFTVNTGLKYEEARHTSDDFHEFLYERSPIVTQTQGPIVITTKPSKPVLYPHFDNNGFVNTIFEAYNMHRNLILSPDDIWVAITTAMSLYVNAHAEEMRKEFVEHEGQIELTVYGSGTMYTADWNDLIQIMSKKIDEKTKNQTRDWLVPEFSTTTNEIATTGKVVMMAVLQKYFTFKFCFLCGIPEVTLKGTLDDWKQLKSKAAKLSQFGQPELAHWATQLDFVLQKFIDSYNGNADKEFWNRIAAINGGGSGPRYTAGWVNVFMPFSDTGKYNLEGVDATAGEWGQIKTNDVPPAVVECPILIDDNGVEHNTKFIAGHMATEYDAVTNSVSPSIQWAIIDLPDEGDAKEEDAKPRYRDPAVFEEMRKHFPQALYYKSV